jgi:hypothetical protein
VALDHVADGSGLVAGPRVRAGQLGTAGSGRAAGRARRGCILWLVTGASKSAMLPRLLAGDREIPAGRVRQDAAWLLADEAAAARTPAP